MAKKNKTKYVLASRNGRSFYNGSFHEVSRAIDVDKKYIYDSKEDVLNDPNYPMVSQWYVIVDMATSRKPKYPYALEVEKSKFPKIEFGRYGEVCPICGINILADEPYVRWTKHRLICIHCIMNQLGNIDELLKTIPLELKDEWNRNGKEDCAKCTDCI